MRLVAFLALTSACAGPLSGDDDPGPDGGLDSPTVVYLTPAQHLTRASIALRGVRPSLDDLRAVAADPDALGGIVDRYLDAPELGTTIREMHNEVLQLRVEETNLQFPLTATLTGATATEINEAIYEEPLRLIEDIVLTGQPYTKVVTADYTMATAITARIWGYTRPGGSPANAWVRTPWPDARGAAGVLATEAVYHRHRSAGFNYNRGRANVISSVFLCHDYAHADIMIDTTVDLSDPDVVANAVVANPSCAGCHQTLDPLASYLFPFRNQININQIVQGNADYPVGGFQANLVERWRTTNRRPPMFFGAPASGLPGLGAAIAADPRFAKCAATRFASYLTEVPADALDGRWIAQLQAAFEANGFDAKHLMKEIVMSDHFRASHDTDEERAGELVGLQKLRPTQLSRMLEDLTGFVWTTPTTRQIRNAPYGEPDLLDSDLLGFRVLAGGIDSFSVGVPVHTMTATSTLVARAVATSAADFVVEHDAAAPAAERTLFVEAAVGATEESAVRAQLAHLHGRIFGELVDAASPEVDESYQLFTTLVGQTNQRRAWKLVLVAMLTDVRSLYY